MTGLPPDAPPRALAARRLTRTAATRLARAGGRARVHSAYASTVNLEVGGGGPAAFVSLHGPGPIPSPFGVACEASPAPAGLAGTRVEAIPGSLVFTSGVRVALEGAAVLDTALEPGAPLPPLGRDLARALAAPRLAGGLLPVVAACLGVAAAPGGPLAAVAAPAIAALVDATAAGAAAGVLAAARPLVGLGPGLTPAGDDLLAGWLAGARAAGGAGVALADGLAGPLLALAAARTGLLSQAFLAAAAAGEVSEPAARFARAPGDGEALDALVAVGHTSGADFLGGYLAARVALAHTPRAGTVA